VARPLSSLAGLREVVLSAAAEMLGDAAGEAPGDGRREGMTLERPPRNELGDYSTNAALLMAPLAGANPREIAERLGARLRERLGEDLERFEVAGPGFLNLFLGDRWHRTALEAVLGERERFGEGGAREPERILIEFVSANPTGPLHVGHARNAAYGDSLARLLAFDGNQVEREFYVNDAGSQVRKLGESIMALNAGRPVPDDGYQGEYVQPLAQRVAQAEPASGDPVELGRGAVQLMIGQIADSLAAFGVGFDHWQYESALHGGEPSAVEHALTRLEEQGRTYHGEGALWLRTIEYGDDKDRVMMRSSGEHTYFASDIAYHLAKRERGFERLIDVWGADHHGYVPRMRAAFQALGGDPERLELIIMQLVHLLHRGERAQMSKRAGEFVTLDDLIDEIGVDAARWFLLSRSHDTTIELDLDLASQRSNENPVYYVQYAHARIASMLTRVGAPRVERALEDPGCGPLHAAERGLIKRLLSFPDEVREAATRRAPHRVSAYALELAQDFTAFYRDCRVVGATPESVESTRLALCTATKGVIARSLELLGVSAPSQM
jgi:arginyl-tRNA synthetase